MVEHKFKVKFFLVIVVSLMVLLISCSKTPYNSLSDKNNFSIVSVPSKIKLRSLIFEATNNIALSADAVTTINGDQISLQLFTGVATNTLIPTLRFCSDDVCNESKTADELEINYKPRYRASDSSFYSCPAPAIDQEYDKTVGWFETAVTSSLCIKEDRNKIFLEPVNYVFSFTSGKTLLYRLSSVFGAATDSLLLTGSFLQINNSNLESDQNAIIVNPGVPPVAPAFVAISSVMPFGSDLTSLVPSFTILGSKISFDDEAGVPIVSSQTAIDFSNSGTTPIKFFVHNLGGSNGIGFDEGTLYHVSITNNPPMISFNIDAVTNAGVSNDYTGIIDHTAKTVKFLTIVPIDDVSSAQPNIVLADISITASPTSASVNNFLGSKVYTFTSSNGSSIDYTVTGLPALNVGDLVITEVMSNPSAVSDTNGEYIEFYNASGSTIDFAVQPILLSDDGGDFGSISTGTLAAGAYFLVCRDSVSGTNGGMTNCDYTPASMSLSGAETISIKQKSNYIVDSFTYTSDNAGVAWELGNNKLTDDNSDMTFWDKATTTYGSGDSGTPGIANSYVYFPPPGSGEVLITEVGNNMGSNVANDYIEIYNNTGRTINLNEIRILRDSGCSISAGFTTEWTMPNETLANNSYAFFSKPGNTLGTAVGHDNIGALDLSGDCFAIINKTTSKAMVTTFNSPGVVDFVGMSGTPTSQEGTPITSETGTDSFIERCVTPTSDTTDNSVDFRAYNVGTNNSIGTVNFCPFLIDSTIVGSTVSELKITFNDLPTAGTGADGSENNGNYCITKNGGETTLGGCTSALAVSSATLLGNTVTLTTATQVSNTPYFIIIGNVSRATDVKIITMAQFSFSGFYAPPTFGQLVITEVNYDTDTATGFEGGGGTVCNDTTDEFVEIYNSSSTTFNLMGMSLQYGTGGGNFNNDFTFPDIEILPSEYIVVVSQDAGCYTTASMVGKKVLFDTANWSYSGTGATIALVEDATVLPGGQVGPVINSGTTTVLDYVGYAAMNVYQNTGATDCTNMSLARILVNNTNNNNVDFGCGINNGTPGRANP